MLRPRSAVLAAAFTFLASLSLSAAGIPATKKKFGVDDLWAVKRVGAGSKDG